MIRQVALSVLALGTVAALAVASLCVPLAYEGEWGPFGVSAGTAALYAVWLVVSLGPTRRPNPARQRTAGT